MKNIMQCPMRMALAGATVFALLAIGQVQAVTVGPGAFSYSYNSQNATGTQVADPNAVLNNIVFSGDGGAPNNSPNYVNFYRIASNNNPPSSMGTLTYTFDASPGQQFSGMASLFDRVNVFNSNGNVLVESSLDGGAFSTIGALRTGATAEYQTNMFNVDGAMQVVIQYNLLNIRGPGEEDQVQLLRQANVNLGGLEQTPFVFSGTTIDKIPEPASIALLGLGSLFGIGMIWRRRA